VRAALRKWNRGESVRVDPKKPHDFTWSPEPPTLRYLAMVERAGVAHRIHKLQRLLEAKPCMTAEQLADGRSAMLGLNSVLQSGDIEALKNLTFAQAIESGDRDQANAATVVVPRLRTLDQPAGVEQEAAE
jgi:hypothetical protein